MRRIQSNFPSSLAVQPLILWGCMMCYTEGQALGTYPLSFLFFSSVHALTKCHEINEKEGGNERIKVSEREPKRV